MMREVRLAHTADLAPADLEAGRALLDAVFGDEMTDADWEHALGGIHALVLADGELVGHGSLVMRRLLHRGRALRTGYVEGVAVHRDHHGRGHGAALMAALEGIARSAYDLGALASTDEALGFYERRGWRRWPGPTAALTPEGIRPTPEADGAVFVMETAVGLDPSQPLVCDWRDGDVW